MGFIFFGFGLIVGSFLNVLILRQGTGRTVSGRSGCFSCGHQLNWYDLVPVFSWLSLWGRCRYCGSKISVQYPLVECATALLFGLIGAAPFPFGLEYRIALCVVGALLVCIAVYDFKHTIIPDIWVYAFAILSFCTMGTFFLLSNEASLLSVLLAGPITAFPLFLFWLISNGRAMGFGDVKLALGMGYLLGPWYGLTAVLGAFIIGGIFCTPLLIFSSNQWRRISASLTHRYHLTIPSLSVTMKSEVPFGPFLILATVAVWMSWLYGTPLPWLLM